MRIVVVGPTDPDSFADNVVDALTSMGHEVRAAGPARSVHKSRMASRIISTLEDLHPPIDPSFQEYRYRQYFDWKPELVITVDKNLHESVIARFKSIKARVVLWFPDHVANLGDHSVLQSGYDHMFFKNSELVRNLRNIYQLPVSYLPEAYNPRWHLSKLPYGGSGGLVVAGNIHPTRALLVESLASDNVPLEIYGPRISSWVNVGASRRFHHGRMIVRSEKADRFRSATAVLNNLHPAELQGSNCRLFEAAGSGALVLSEWRSDMDGLFLRDSEVLSFTSYDELQSKFSRARNDHEWARSIADAARARAEREHTYDKRLENLIKVTSGS